MLFYFVLEKSKGWGLRMNRPPKTKLAAALTGVVLTLSSMSATAAGMGKLSIGSALGQPLSAEIELVSLQPGEFESIAARVASPESYSDAKVEYSPLLRQLRFTVERRSDGKPILKIASNAPINEPFLDVLVEMNWPAGRLLREYPILLDPPGFNEARIAPQVATVTPVRPTAPVVTPAVTPDPAPDAPVAATPAKASTPTATVSSGATGTPSAKTESGNDTYGPVKRGDTLSKIAQEMKSDTVSLEQMLVALYRENKSAFIGDNMNRLRTGQILKVPSADEVAQIAEKDARAEIKVQVANWNAYREQAAGSAPMAAAKPEVATNQATGKIAVAKPDTPAPVALPKDQLKIAKSDAVGGKAGSAGASGGGSNLQEQITALKEEKIARENSLREANSRVVDLEKQIGDMRKLMELKGVGKTDTKAAPEPAKPADVKVATVTPPPKVEPPKVEPPKVEPPKVEPPKVDARPADTKAEPPKTDAAKPVDAAKPPAPKPAPPKTPVKAPPPPEPNFIEDNMVALGGGAAGVLGVGGLLFYMSRRKKKPSGGNSTSMSKTSSIMPSDLKPNTVTGNRGGGLVDTGNSSFLTDFDKTGPGSIDTDEVDPVAEAEVYIAYGRDAQAEEILKEAMSRDKSRHEITVKLLEIYHARKSTQAFETVARELKDTIGGDNPTWAKVAAMGSSIDPQNTLYGGSGQAYQTTGAFAAGGTAVMAAVETEKAPPDLDFDLGFGDSHAPAAATFDVTAPTTSQSQDAPNVDFDLDLNTGSHPDAAAGGGGLDFDLALNAPASTSAPASAAAPAAFDFDLSSLSLDSANATTPKPTPAVSSHDKTTAMSLSDLSLDLDAPAAGGSGDGGGAVSTKLELAKAYIEIGDSEGAKEILNEVAREGTAAQQQEAKKILAGM